MINKNLLVIGNMVKFYEYGYSGRDIVGQIKAVDDLNYELCVTDLSGKEWIVGASSVVHCWIN